jgi:hypothetical protein
MSTMFTGQTVDALPSRLCEPENFPSVTNEFSSVLQEIGEMCRNNPELALLDAGLTLIAFVYFSNRTVGACLLAMKNFVKEVALIDHVAYRMVEKTLKATEARLSVLAASASIDDDDYGSELSAESDPIVPPNKDDVRHYFYNMRLWSIVGMPWDRHFKGALTWEDAGKLVHEMSALEERFYRTYGFRGIGVPFHEFAAQVKMCSDIADVVEDEDVIPRMRNAGIGEAFAGITGRMKNMHSIITGNAIVVALLGIFGVSTVTMASPMLGSIAYNLMGPGKDFGKLLRDLATLARDSAAYVGYCYSGDQAWLDCVGDKLTREIVLHDSLDVRMKERVGDGLRLRADVESHVEKVIAGHALAHRIKANDVSSWGALLVRALHMRDSVRRRPAANRKLEPYVLFMEGPNGTGKTTIVEEYFSRIVSAYRDESAPDDGSFGSSFTPSDKNFWDGFSSSTQVFISDDKMTHTFKAAGDTFITEFLTMCSSKVTIAPMSAVEDKGSIPVLVSLVVLCENTIDSVNDWSRMPGPFLRRADLKIEMKYVAGLKAGQEITDFETQVIGSAYKYQIPRDNSFGVGTWKMVFVGTPREVMDFVVEDAARSGVRARAKHEHSMTGRGCKTCGRAECTLGGNVPRSMHFAALNLPDPREGVDVVVGGEMVMAAVSATVVIAVLGAIWTVVSTAAVVRQTSTVMGWNDLIYNRYALGSAALYGLASVLGMTTVVLLTVPYFAWFITFGTWNRHLLAQTMKARWRALDFLAIGDRLLPGFTNKARARFIMAKAFTGYVITAEEAVLAFKASRKYGILLRIAGLVLVVGGSVALSRVIRPAAYDQTMTVMKNISSAGTPFKRVLRRYVVAGGTPTGDSAAVLVLGHNLGLTVNHIFNGVKGSCRIFPSTTRSEGLFPSQGYEISTKEINYLPTDFALVHDTHLCVYDHDVVVKYLPLQTREAIAIILTLTNEVHEELVVAHACYNMSPMWNNGRCGGPGCPTYRVERVYKRGECGSVLTVVEDGKVVVFATLVGTDDKAWSAFQAITPDVVSALSLMRANLPDGPSVQSLMSISARVPVKVVDLVLHPKSALQYADPANFVFLGRAVPEHNQNAKSQMRHTTYHKVVLAEFGYHDVWMVPDPKPRLREGDQYPRGMMTSYVEDINEAVDGVKDYPDQIRVVTDHFRSLFDNVKKTRPLTVFEAVNGVPGVFKGINRKTSIGGFGRSGPKKRVLVSSPCQHYPDGVVLPLEMNMKVHEILVTWDRGEHVFVTSCTSAKMDEVRTKPIARQINVCDVEVLVALRTLLEPLNKLMRENPRFQSLIGRSLVGKDARVVLETLLEMNFLKWSDLDAMYFDHVHMATVRAWVADQLKWLAEQAGYGWRKARSVWQAVHDLFNAYQHSMGELFIALAGIISGVTATGDIQTLIGWFVVRLCMVILYGAAVLEKMSCWHGGDDALLSVKEEVGYSGAALREQMLKLGYHYTSDTDKTKPPEAHPRAECTVYKRHLYEAEGRVFAPLVEKSVVKMLTWSNGRTDWTVREQEVELLRIALNETFLRGRAEYAIGSQKLVRVAASIQVDLQVPDYETMLARYDAGDLPFWEYAPELPEGEICTCHPEIMASLGTGVDHDTCCVMMHNISGTVELALPTMTTDPQSLSAHDAGEESRALDVPRPLSLPGLTEVSMALRRPVQITTIAWTVGLQTSIYPIELLQANAIYNRNIDYFYAHNFKLRIKLTLTLPGTFGGVLLASIMANSSQFQNAAQEFNHPEQVVTHDCTGMLDVALGNSIELVKTYPRLQGAMFPASTGNYNGPSGLLLNLCELIPAFATDGGTVGTPAIVVWASLEDAEQYAPTSLLSISAKVRLPEYTARFSNAVASFTSLVPRLSDVVGSVLSAGQAMTSSLRQMGYNFVAQLPLGDFVLTRTLPFFATGEGTDMSVRLDYWPESLTTRNQEVITGDVGDTLALSYLYGKWGYVGNKTWSGSAAADTQILVLPVTPYMGGPTAGTPLQLVAALHDKWTGSMRIRIYISCTSLMRGALMFTWVPNLSGSGTISGSTMLQPLQVDIAGSTEVILTVPWGQRQPAISYSNIPGGAPVFPTLTSGAPSGSNNGNVVVTVIQPLRITGTGTPTAYLAIFTQPGDDFALFDQTDALIQDYYMISAPVPLPPLLQTAAARVEHRFQAMERTPEMVSAMTGGCILQNLRVMLKRKSPAVVHTNFVAPLVNPTNQKLVRIPLYDWWIPSTTPVDGTPTQFVRNPLGWISSAFAFWAGSTRHTLIVVEGPLAGNAFGNSAGPHAIQRELRSNIGPTSQNRYVWAPPITTIYGAESMVYNDFVSGADVLQTGFSNTPAPLSAEIPFVCDSYALPINNAANVGTVGASALITTSFVQALTVVDYQSVGDDFQLIEWIGVPVITNQPLSATQWNVC